MKSLIHKIKDKAHELKDKTHDMRDEKGSQATEFPRTGLQPGIDQTEAGTAKDTHHSMGSEAAVNKPGSGISSITGAAGREQLAPKEPIVHIRGPEVSKVPMAQPRATETKPQDVIAPSPHGTTNLGGVDNPKDAGYAPLREGVSSAPASATDVMGGYTSQGKGFPDSKPAVTDVGLGPDTSKIGSKPDTSKIGAATKGHLEQAEPLLSHKAHENKAVHGTGMGLPNSAQDTGFNSSKPSSTNTTSAPDVSKMAAKFDTSPGTHSDNAGILSQKAKDNKATHGTGMGLPASVEDTASKKTSDKGGDFTFDKMVGGDKISSASKDNKDHTDSSSKRSDYTSALDKIAGESADTANSAAEGTKGVATTAAEYVRDGARTVAQKAKEVHESVNDGTVKDKANATGKAAGDKAQAAKDTVVDTAAKGTQNVQDAVKPYADAAADKTKAALDSVQEKAGVAGRDDMTVFQKAQAIVQTAAAATAEKAGQVYEVVAQKVHETGVPQAAQEHAATARDTVANTAAQARDTAVEQAAVAREMAAQKYDELSTEAQRHKDAGLKALDQGKLKAQEHAQLAADMANRKASELAQNVREASVEDVNRSWLGRTTGGIVLVALASYALGVPFRYGLAAALFALAAVLFADWDRSRSATGRRTPLMATTQPRTVHVRPTPVVQSTEFGVVKADAGRIEEGPLGGHRFVKKEECLDEKPLTATTVRYAKEE